MKCYMYDAIAVLFTMEDFKNKILEIKYILYFNFTIYIYIVYKSLWFCKYLFYIKIRFQFRIIKKKKNYKCTKINKTTDL